MAFWWRRRTPRECLALHDDWVARCERYFARETPPPVRRRPRLGSAALRKTLAELRRAWREAFGARPSSSAFPDDPELAGALVERRPPDLAAGSLTPDHIVYTGAHAVVAESLDELPAKLKPALDEKSSPRRGHRQGRGNFPDGRRPLKLDAAEALALAGAKIIALGRRARRGAQPGPGLRRFHRQLGSRTLPRAKPCGSAPRAAGGPGGAGHRRGFGPGMRHRAGPGGSRSLGGFLRHRCAGADDSPRPLPRNRAARWPCAWTSPSEESVAEAFDRVVAHWGGVDIVVCAAGIAPPYELVDMPVAQWRLALEINLTGYFLVAREAARIMRAQGEGGAMVMLSSKSGLDASKSQLRIQRHQGGRAASDARLGAGTRAGRHSRQRRGAGQRFRRIEDLEPRVH